MQDGYTQSGAGASDMRVASRDLQHGRQLPGARKEPIEHRMMIQEAGQGGPMKQALDQELARHKESKQMRLSDLESNYKR